MESKVKINSTQPKITRHSLSICLASLPFLLYPSIFLMWRCWLKLNKPPQWSHWELNYRHRPTLSPHCVSAARESYPPLITSEQKMEALCLKENKKGEHNTDEQQSYRLSHVFYWFWLFDQMGRDWFKQRFDLKCQR